MKQHGGNNQFKLNGDRVSGILFDDISNTQLSANHFSGTGLLAVNISDSSPVSGWILTANTGLGSFTATSGADIHLGGNTSACIIGKGQDASINDAGTGNIVLQ